MEYDASENYSVYFTTRNRGENLPGTDALIGIAYINSEFEFTSSTDYSGIHNQIFPLNSIGSIWTGNSKVLSLNRRTNTQNTAFFIFNDNDASSPSTYVV